MDWLSLLGLDTLVLRWRAATIEAAIAAEDRLTLARLEWADQKRRVGRLVLLVIALAALTVVTLMLLSLAIIVQFWDTPHRALAAWLVAGGWLVAWAIALGLLVAVARAAGNGFALTRRELARDWTDLKERL